MVTARKSNPGFLTDDELVASFCVRTHEFESVVEVLRDCVGGANTHQIVIGPRGSGKTSLLLRVAAETRRDEQLSSQFFPVVYAEESYEVSTTGEFWLECLSRLGDQAPHRENGPDLRRSFEDLRQIRDDRTLAERCLGVLQDFADREGKRLVLIVENLNMLLRDIGDEDSGWQLRHTLQTEPRILLLASATSRFDEIDNPDKALYDLFRVLSLPPLDLNDCSTLWETVAGEARARETIQALRILTGGSPRLLTIVARFGATLSFRELMADLLTLVDDHTEYFKSHLDALPAQERKVYLALIQLWKPVTAREIADRARLATSQCSAQLKRLTERGVVEVAGGTERRKLYYVAERLYNIYYLMRRARGRDSLIEALIRFMEALYSPSELKELVVRAAREATVLDGEDKRIHQMAFDRLLESPFLSVHREELGSLESGVHPFDVDDAEGVRVLFERALEAASRGHQSDAITMWEEVIHRLERSNAPEHLLGVAAALDNKGTALYDLNRTDEAVTTWDDVVRRVGSSQTPEHIGATAIALTKKAFVLRERGLQAEALAACEDALRRLAQENAAQPPLVIAEALHLAGLVLRDLDQPERALDTWDQLLRSFAEDDPATVEWTCSVLHDKGKLLADANRLEEALAVWEEAVRRFGSNTAETAQEAVVAALIRSGSVLVDLKRPQDALYKLEDVIRRLETTSVESVAPAVMAAALLGKAKALVYLDRLQEAVAVCDEVLERHGDSPESLGPVAAALAAKGDLLVGLSRPLAALATLDEAVRRCETSGRPELLDMAKVALLEIANLHFSMDDCDASAVAVNRLFEQEGERPPTLECQAYITRACANCVNGDNAACVADLEKALSILPELESLPNEVLDGLFWLAVELGPAELHEAIVTSPASKMLFPLTAALKRELGQHIPVAKEVEEVAEDIRRDLEGRRKARRGALQ